MKKSRTGDGSSEDIIVVRWEDWPIAQWMDERMKKSMNRRMAEY